VPLINVKLIEGVFTKEQKEQMGRDLTEAMIAIEGENMRSVTWCVIEEVKSGDWSLGGQALTTEAVRELAASGGRQSAELAEPTGRVESGTPRAA
jgi:4-oxalocrotonate tautomerase